MIFQRTLAPPNSILFVCDQDTGELPDLDSLGTDLVAATSSCLVVGTFPEPDGPTSIVLSDSEVDPTELDGMQEVFDGPVDAPTHELHLCVVPFEAIATVQVNGPLARVRVWANHDYEPDRLVIVVTAAVVSTSGEHGVGESAQSPAAAEKPPTRSRAVRILRSLGLWVLFLGVGISFAAGLGERQGRRVNFGVESRAIADKLAADARVAWHRARNGSKADLPEGLARTAAEALLRPGLSMPEIRAELGPPDAIENDGLEWVYTLSRKPSLDPAAPVPSFHLESLRIYFDESRKVRAWGVRETIGQGD